MARAFQRLAKDAARGRNTARVLNWANRLHHLEQCLFEINSYLVTHLTETAAGRTLTSKEENFLQAAEEFRAHVKSVLEATHGA